jgi:2,4-dienoyl-CoA reductase (NADPH2)
VHTQRPIWCVVNPGTGHEWAPPPVAATRRRVVVVGAGVAGLEAARTAAERGARRPRSSRPGPTSAASSGSPRPCPAGPSSGGCLDWYAAEVERLKVDLRLGTTADAELLARLDPDAVVVASGGVGIAPAVPGIDAPRVADLRTWLDLRPPVPDGQTVTIWGADRVGVAAADVIAAPAPWCC